MFKQAHIGPVQKSVFQSMAPDTSIATTVIDIWSMLMNEEEEIRDRTAPHRLFCATIVVCNLIINYIDLYSKELLI